MGLVIGLMAADDKYGIGMDGMLPWRNDVKDMRLFYQLTVNTPVVMGRSTWESLPRNVKPLVSRDNYVLTSREAPSGTFKAPPSGLCSLGDVVHVIGGVETFKHYHEEIDIYIVSRIQGEFDCDVFFTPPHPTEMTAMSTQSGGGLEVHLYIKRGIDEDYVRMIVSKIKSIV